MSQSAFSNIDKAAALLSQLEPKSLERVFEILGPEFASTLRPMVAAINRRKDFDSLSEQVLQEFREIQQDVRASIGLGPMPSAPAPQMPAGYPMHAPAPPDSMIWREAQLRRDPFDRTINTAQQAYPYGPYMGYSAHPTTGPQAYPPHQPYLPHPGESEPATTARPPVPTAAPGVAPVEQSMPTVESIEESPEVKSLSQIPPQVIAAALKTESPRMIATVLKQLPTDISGRVLEQLPAENRQNIFLLMADTVQANPAVVSRVLQRLLEVCRTVDPAVVDQADRRVKTLIGVLQSVERDERVRLMESLAERDPDLAAAVDDQMYDYSDLLRIEDRSVQKLLSQLEQKVVAMALKSAPEDLRQKVFKNLSERVRLALNEEMELLTGVSASKAEAARREIANVIRSQDKEGSLLWIE